MRPVPKYRASDGIKGEATRKAIAGMAPIRPIISLPISLLSIERETRGMDKLRDIAITVTAAIMAMIALFR